MNNPRSTATNPYSTTPNTNPGQQPNRRRGGAAGAGRGRGHNEFDQPISQSQSPSTLNPSATESTLGDSDIGGQQYQHPQPNLAPQETNFGELAGYGFPPGGPLVWDNDWNIPLAFGEFSTHYQPQGELAQELQSQPLIVNDFSNPIPVRQDLRLQPPPPPLVPTPTPRQFQFQPSVPPSPLLQRHTSVSTRGGDVGHESAIPPRTREPSMTVPSNHSTTTAQTMAEPSSTRPTVPTRAGSKRKADSSPSSSSKQQGQAADPSPPKRASMARPPQPGKSQSSRLTRSQANVDDDDVDDDDDDGDVEPTPRRETGNLQRSESTSKKNAEAAAANRTRRIVEMNKLTTVLPAGKVFPIQIGSELFRLSGASISSDAPSYFSHYFGEQLIQTGGRASQVKTLYIDRDPATFRDIGLHLQGYFVKPRDEEHFVRLFADAQFYSLPRLTQQLFKSEIFIQVGDRHFQIPRDIFSGPGDSPNFFSLGFAHFFSTPSEVFPGLDRQTLLRPPSILPPNIPNRSGDVFADLLRLLQGYDVNTRDAGHRAELLRDARYFHLKGLEQKLLPCEITFNALRGKSEILLRLEDIRQSGVSFSPDLGTTDNLPTSKNNSATTSTSKPATPSLEPNPTPSNTTTTPSGTITYQRPFIDTTSHDLILEISTPESMTLDLGAMRATFTGTTKARIASLFQVIANKLNLPSMLPLGLIMLQSGGGVANLPASPANSGVSGDRVRVAIGRDAWVEVDGGVVEWGSGREEGSSDGDGEEEEGLPKIKRWKDRVDVDVDVRELGGEWVVKRGQWRLRVDANEEGKVEVSLVAVKIECFTGEVYRNGERRFLV